MINLMQTMNMTSGYTEVAPINKKPTRSLRRFTKGRHANNHDNVVSGKSKMPRPGKDKKMKKAAVENKHKLYAYQKKNDFLKFDAIVAALEVDVGEQQVGLGFPGKRNAPHAAGDAGNAVPETGQSALDLTSNQRLVFDDEDGLVHASSYSRRR